MKFDNPLQQYLAILFNPGELVRVGNDYAQDRDDVVVIGQAPARIAQLKPSFDGCFITLNPIVYPHAIEICSVSGHRVNRQQQVIPRNILLEIDDPRMSLDDHIKFFKSAGVPWSTMVFSGGKSLHVVIAMEEPFESLHTYNQYCYALHRALHKRTDLQVNVKSTTKLPGCYRSKANISVEQKLVALDKKISRKRLDSYLTIMGQLHWTRRPEREWRGEYHTPAKVLGYLETVRTHQKKAGGQYINCECPACGKENMWFGRENGSFGCHTDGCGKSAILECIPNELGEGVDVSNYTFQREREAKHITDCH